MKKISTYAINITFSRKHANICVYHYFLKKHNFKLSHGLQVWLFTQCSISVWRICGTVEGEDGVLFQLDSANLIAFASNSVHKWYSLQHLHLGFLSGLPLQVSWQHNFYALCTSSIHANTPPICDVSGFQCGVFEAFTLLRCCVAEIGNWLLKFQDNLSIPLSWFSWILKMVHTGCPQTSVNKCQPTLHNIPEEQQPSTQFILLYLITLIYGERYKLSGSLFWNFILPLIDTIIHLSTVSSNLLLHCL